MDFQTFLVYTFLMTFCVGAGYMLALCPINKVNQEGRVERNRLRLAKAAAISPLGCLSNIDINLLIND